MSMDNMYIYDFYVLYLYYLIMLILISLNSILLLHFYIIDEHIFCKGPRHCLIIITFSSLYY